MQNRIIEFVRGLRAAGVAVSTAEGMDALRAVQALGIADKPLFRESLRTTLVKAVRDFEPFDELFPLYFGTAVPPFSDAFDSLSGDEQEMLQQTLAGFDERIAQLLEWLARGDGPTADELRRIADASGIQWVENPRHSIWVTRRMLQQLGFGQLTEKIQQLVQQLTEMGMSEQSIAGLTGIMQANREALEQQIAAEVGLEIARRRAERPRDLHGSDLLQKSFAALTPQDVEKLRYELRRLIAQLKTRAALRRKKERRGHLDLRRTLRRNQRYAGIPLELQFRHKKRKPRLVLIFDASNSMRQVVEFMLHFVAEMQDQVSQLRSFAFYDNLGEVTDVVRALNTAEMGQAFSAVQRAIPGYLYGTNLGRSLQTFWESHLSAITPHTTVIIMGDGRNNHSNPRLDLVRELHHRAKRLIWFTPEHERLWGTGDSDMHLYATLCDEVYPVRNLAQLSAAVDKILED
ncbi:MAG: VWA domain-containing protein [Chloroflexi bacterium]|nr:VWA domain-containing protein [Chloroflexota bacterium]